MLAIPARVISTSFALTCFAATLCFGIYNSNSWMSVLSGALLAGLIAWIIGMVIGAIALKTVDEHIRAYKEQRPIPEDLPSDAEAHQDQSQAVAG